MLENDGNDFDSNPDIMLLNNYEDTETSNVKILENETSSSSSTSSSEHSTEDGEDLGPQNHLYGQHDHHGGYIKKLRKKFEKSNEKISAEICRINPNEVAQNIMSSMSRNLDSLSEPLIGSSKERVKHYKKSKHSIVSRNHNDDDTSQRDLDSIAPSRKVKKKRIKVKRITSNKTIHDDNKTIVPIRSNTQISEARTHKKVKIIHNKSSKKLTRKKPIKITSNEKYKSVNNSPRNSRHSLRQEKYHDYRKDLEMEKYERKPEKTFIRDNPINIIDDEDGIKNETNSVEKLHESPTSTFLNTEDHERESLLRNLNLLLNNHSNNFQNYNRNDPMRYQSSRYSNNYEMPTIASQMKKVNRALYTKQPTDSFARIPFVVGTSVSTTNNVHLLKQLIASKIKTYLLSTITEAQLTGWNVHNLRLLIQGIEKFGGGTYKLRNSVRNRQMMNQQDDLNQFTASKETI